METKDYDDCIQQLQIITSEKEALKSEVIILQQTNEELQTSLEIASVELESGKRQLEEIERLHEDVEMQLNLKIVEKELECERLRSLKTQNTFLQSKVNEIEDMRHQDVLKKEEYRVAFEELSKWHMEKQQKLLEVEFALNKSKIDYTNALQMMAVFQSSLEENREVIEMYQQLTSSTDKLLSERKQNEKSLCMKLSRTNEELENYKVASDALLIEIKERETILNKRLDEVRQENDHLIKISKTVKPQSGIWHISPYECTQIEYSPAARLMIGVQSMKMQHADVILQYTKHPVIGELCDTVNNELCVILTAVRCYDKALLLLEYLDSQHLQVLFETFREASQSSTGNRGFIRWLAMTGIHVLCITSSLYRLSFMMRRIPKLKFDEVSRIDDEFHKSLTKGEIILNKLIEVSQNNNLSSSVNVSNLEQFTSELLTIEGKLYNREYIVESMLQISVLRDMIFKCKIICLIGVSKAAVDNEAEVLPHPSWVSLHELCVTALKQFPTINISNELFDVNGRGSPRIESDDLNEVLIYESVERFEELMLHNRENQQNIGGVQSVGSALKVLEDGLINIATLINSQLLSRTERLYTQPPWEEAIIAASNKLLREKKAEVELQNCLQELNDQKEENRLISEDAKKINNESQKWKEKFSKERVIAESLMVYEFEYKRLSEEKKQFVALLDALRDEKEHLQIECAEKSEEKSELLKSYADLKNKFETKKQVANRQAQNEYYAREASAMKLIIQKLQLQLSRFEYKEMENLLEDVDLHYTPPILFAEEAHRLQKPEFGDAYTPLGRGEIDVNMLVRKEFPHIPSTQRVFKLLSEHRAFKQEVLLHNCRSPIWDPCESPLENETRIREYRESHDELQQKGRAIEKELDAYISTVSEDGALSRTFGDHRNAYGFRYMRAFSELAGIDSHDISKQPAARIVLPHEGDEHKSVCSNPQRLLVTDEQLGALHKKLVGL